MNNPKIRRRRCLFVTGTRAEYGLMYWLMKEVQASKKLELQLAVTCMHLSPEFGLTWKQIEKDGFRIDWKVEMLLSSDTPAGIVKSMGVAQIGFADALEKLQPDIIIVLGDRFELLSVVSAALIHRIPVAHLHGGEATEGTIDEAVRHSISKMSHLHFAATQTYCRRIIQLGENPKRVFNVGGLGIDNIKKLKLLDRRSFEESIGMKLGKRNLMVTFHPVTLEKKTAREQFSNLLEVLKENEDIHVIFTMPNADTEGRVIILMIEEFVAQHAERCVAFISMGQLRYLSALKHVDGVLGNSSSGLIEAPSFRIGTVNMGDRQRGRMMADSVISCGSDAASIKTALKKLYSDDFSKRLKRVKNPYGNGGAAVKIRRILEDFPFDNILKKKFYDICS